MYRMRLFLMLVVVLGLTPLVTAQENELGISFDLTYTSKWLSKGVEAYG